MCLRKFACSSFLLLRGRDEPWHRFMEPSAGFIGGALAAGHGANGRPRGVVLAAGHGANGRAHWASSGRGSDWRSSWVAVSAASASDDPQRHYDEANMEDMTQQERVEAGMVTTTVSHRAENRKSLPELETVAAEVPQRNAS